MGTKLSLTAEGVLVLDDGHRTIELQRSRLFAMGGLDLPFSRQRVRYPGEATSPPPPPPASAPAPQPPEQSTRPGRPRIPLPSMFRSPLDPELEIPSRLVHVARLDLMDPQLKEAWGKSIRRASSVVRHAALWSDLNTYSAKAVAEHLTSQAEHGVIADARILNVLLLKQDLTSPLDLGAVASKGADLSPDIQTVQVYYVPGM